MKKWYWLILLILALLFPLIFSGQYILSVATLVLLNAYWATSWNVIGGYAGQMALGNGVYIGLGAYITGALFKYNNLSPWIGVLIAGLICGIFAIIISYPVLKLRGTYFAISTTALLHIIRMVWQQEEIIFGWNMGGTAGLKIPWYGNFVDMQFLNKAAYYYITLGILVIMLLFAYYIENSKTGYYFIAIRGNQEAAASMGVNVHAYKLLAQFISTFLMALGGGIFAMYVMYVDPVRMLGYEFALQVVLYAVIGGRGTLWGPFLGAILLYPVNEFIRINFSSKLPGISTLVYGIALVLIIYFLPGGLISYIHKIERWFTDKKNERKAVRG